MVSLTIIFILSSLIFRGRTENVGSGRNDDSNADGKNKTLDVHYDHYYLDEICKHSSKLEIRIGSGAAKFMLSRGAYKGKPAECHLEIEVPSGHGISAFIEEMNFKQEQYSRRCVDSLQFGRDVLFITTHESDAFCGQRTRPIVTGRGFAGGFPRIGDDARVYHEGRDNEMDMWVRIVDDDPRKNLTVIVTSYLRNCEEDDEVYAKCKYSSQCIKRVYFCDGHVNCAFPYREPADETRCGDEGWSPSSVGNGVLLVAIIFLVIAVALAALLFFFKSALGKIRGARQANPAQGGSTAGRQVDSIPVEERATEQSLVQNEDLPPAYDTLDFDKVPPPKYKDAIPTAPEPTPPPEENA